MTHILFMGDLAGTGFGSVTMDLGRALLNLGHDVRFVSQNEIGELGEPFKSRTFSVNDPDGWIRLEAVGLIGIFDGSVWLDKWAPEAAIILGDFNAVRQVVMANEETRHAFSYVPTFHYVPIEGIDSPPSWRELWTVVHPIAMSEFGATEVERLTGHRPPVVYHGIDTSQFRPVSQMSPLRLRGKKGPDGAMDRTVRTKAECKAVFAYDGTQSWTAVVKRMENRRWLFRADRHMPRKMYASLLRSVAPVLAANSDRYMVIHCRTDDEGGNLRNLIAKYPPFIASRMILTGFHDENRFEGASRDILTALYNAADVYVSASAEGFGLTVAEAIACGVPAVGMDYSAVPEVIGPAGITVPVGAYIDNEYDYLWARPDERKFTEAVASLLDDDVLRKRLGRAGPDHVRANFSWDRAALQFSAAISDKLTARAAA